MNARETPDADEGKASALLIRITVLAIRDHTSNPQSQWNCTV